MIVRKLISHTYLPRPVVPFWALLTVVLLCFGVFMLMLGSPDTLWSMDNTGDQISDPVLEGLSITSTAGAIARPLFSTRLRPDPRRLVSIAIERSLFRPPNSNR